MPDLGHGKEVRETKVLVAEAGIRVAAIGPELGGTVIPIEDVGVDVSVEMRDNAGVTQVNLKTASESTFSKGIKTDSIIPETGDTVTLGEDGSDSRIEVKDASDVTKVVINSNGDSVFNGGSVVFNKVTRLPVEVSLADGLYIDIPVSTKGWGTIIAGDNQESTDFRFSSDATVTLINPSANVDDDDTPGNLCIFDNGAAVRIKNRLGLTLHFIGGIYYFPVQP